MNTLKAAFEKNWKAYFMEAVCLGIFMVSASIFTTILEYPNSIIHRWIPNDFVRLCIMGLAMGVTASLINYSPMGRLSGAHMNPAVTLTFFRLRKVKGPDTFYYILFQCLGGVLAVYLMHTVIGSAFADPHVNFVITAPGKYGATIAFVAETGIAFCMMTMVLATSNHPMLARYTGVIAGFFVMSYVILTGPISGFGMNPARSLASAVPAMQFPSFWIYITAPFIGMLVAAEVFARFGGEAICAKMFHCKFYPCIFNCGYCEHTAIDNSKRIKLNSTNSDKLKS